MDNPPHSDAHTRASPCAEVNQSPAHEPEAQQMSVCPGAVQSSSDNSPVDKLKLEVRIVLTRIPPAAFGHGLGSPTAEAEEVCAQNDRASCDHTSSGIKSGGVDRGVQVNQLRAEVCTETTDKSAPQYIVDEEAILQLMKTCPLCSKQCRCNKYARGPYFIVYQSCYFCDYRRKWASQPEAINMNIQRR